MKGCINCNRKMTRRNQLKGNSRRKKMKPRARSDKNDEAEVPEHLGRGSWQAGPASSKEPSSVRSPVTRNCDIQNRWKGGCSGLKGSTPGPSSTTSIPTVLTAALSHPLRPPGSGPYHLETSTLIGSISFALTANPQGWRSPRSA